MDELVIKTIEAAKARPESWWVTKLGTVLVHNPDVAMFVGGGRLLFRFGIAMPPVFRRDDIAPIDISFSDANSLWKTYGWVCAEQMKTRRAKALSDAGR